VVPLSRTTTTTTTPRVLRCQRRFFSQNAEGGGDEASGAGAHTTDEAHEASTTEETHEAALAAECSAYWAEVGPLWEEAFATFDVRAAIEREEVAPRNVLRAEAEVRQGTLEVRRRYRGMTVEKLLPRWREVDARRAALKAAGAWDRTVAEHSEEVEAVRTALPDDDGPRGDDANANANANVDAVGRFLVKQLQQSFGPMTRLLVAGSQETRWLSWALFEVFEKELESDRQAAARQRVRDALERNGRNVNWVRQQLGVEDNTALSDDEVLDMYMMSPQANLVPLLVFGGITAAIVYFVGSTVVSLVDTFILQPLGWSSAPVSTLADSLPGASGAASPDTAGSSWFGDVFSSSDSRGLNAAMDALVKKTQMSRGGI